MNWFTGVLILSYLGLCETRAPAPHQACESRWNWALGVLVPSPIQGALPAVGRMLGLPRRRYSDAIPEEEPRP